MGRGSRRRRRGLCRSVGGESSTAQGRPSVARRGQGSEGHGGGAAAHALYQGAPEAWPTAGCGCGMWVTGLQPRLEHQDQDQRSPRASHPARCPGGSTAGRMLGRQAPRPLRPPAQARARHSQARCSLPRARAGERSCSGGQVSSPQWATSFGSEAGWRAVSSLRAVGVGLHHLAVHGHGEGQAQDLRRRAGLGRAAPGTAAGPHPPSREPPAGPGPDRPQTCPCLKLGSATLGSTGWVSAPRGAQPDPQQPSSAHDCT